MITKNIINEEYKYSDSTAKIIDAPMDVHLAQAINYLEAYDLEIGLLQNLNFPTTISNLYPKNYTQSLKITSRRKLFFIDKKYVKKI